MNKIKPDPQSYAIHWILDPQRETYIWIVEFVCDIAVGANSGFQGSQFLLNNSLLTQTRTPCKKPLLSRLSRGGSIIVYKCDACNRGAVAPAYENKTRMARINLDINLHSFDIKKRKLRIAGYF